MTRDSAASLLLLIALPVLVEGASCSAPEKWEQAIAAKGGRDKLESVRTFFWSGERVWWQGLSRRKFLQQAFYVFPDSEWWYQDSGDPRFGWVGDHFYNDRGYYLNAFEGGKTVRRPLPEKPYPQRFPVLLMETRWMKPELKNCTVDATGQEVVIEAVFFGSRYDFYFGPGERLPSKVVVYDARGVLTEMKLADYKPFGGIMLPTVFRERTRPEGGFWRVKMRYEINPEFSPRLLESDPAETMAPEGWRKPRSDGKDNR